MSASPSLAHKFTDAAIVWTPHGRGMVDATFCAMYIGAYFTEHAEFHTGILVRFGNTRFDDYARDEAEARAWIEQAFVEWIGKTRPPGGVPLTSQELADVYHRAFKRWPRTALQARIDGALPWFLAHRRYAARAVSLCAFWRSRVRR